MIELRAIFAAADDRESATLNDARRHILSSGEPRIEGAENIVGRATA